MTSRHHHNSDGLFSTRVQSRTKFPYNFLVILCCVTATLLVGCWSEKKTNPTPDSVQTSNSQIAQCGENNAQDDSNTITAEVVALEQIITFNRFGAFNPAGMVYALRKDVVYDDPTTKEVEKLPLPEASKLDDPDFAKSIAGRVSLKSDKRPRPLVLRVNECNYLQVKFWNLLSPLPTIHTRFERADFPQGGVQRHSVQNPTPLGISLTDISSPPRCLNEKGEKVNNAQNCANPNANLFPFPRQEEPDYPTTRAASMHVNGLDYANIDSDGANVGKNPSSLAEPGASKTYTWYARQEGGYFFYSAGALAGGEGDGGQLGLGLFGSVNVEPQKSVWYRSQVTHGDLTKAKTSASTHYDDLDYKKLAILDADNQIVHSDLNAIIYQTDKTNETPEICAQRSPGSSCGMSFREFTTIFHDENKVFQAFAELSDEGNPISAVADGMAINYGSSGVGSVVLANKKHIGPGKDCPDCKLEEFFLSSWVNGDPAMIVRRNMDGTEMEALYPDDPSNVHHSYLGDPVRFRNIHAGPKETHVFHLHAHQWLQDKNDPNANYLDSQTISPGSSYTYDIQYGGGGNRNLTVGDAIFHCHLYPHFAAGMWELWRNHDVFEDGMSSINAHQAKLPDYRIRSLPDYEIKGGTPNPAIVPIPGFPLAPLPTKEVRGYPFFMAAEPGHRPPQPPMDMALNEQTSDPADRLDGGLPRHIITDGTEKKPLSPDELVEGRGDRDANKASRYVAKRTWKLNSDPNNLGLAKEIESATVKILPQCGTKDEILAMAYHAGWDKATIAGLKQGITPKNMIDLTKNEPNKLWRACKDDFKQALAGLPDSFQWNYQTKETAWPINRKIHSDPANPNSALAPMSPLWKGKGYETTNASTQTTGHAVSIADNPGNQYRVNGFAPAQGAPFAEPCPTEYYEEPTPSKNGKKVIVNRDNPRLYKSAYIQFDLTVNKYGWHDPQARMPVLEEDAANTIDGTRLAEPLFFRANSGDCIQFQATNLIPNILNLDDFQVYSPTDTIGQHIHLVKFDVTSSDGSANGWNYEDGTFSPDEVRERIEASKHGSVINWDKKQHAKLEWADYKLPKGSAHTDKLGKCSGSAEDNNKNHPWCGAQATVQRWWADPVLNDKWDDRTMRAVFTHDHYGPSSHQQHGFYAALIVEPKDTVWTQLGGNPESVVAKNNNGVNTLKCAQPNSPDKAVTAIGKGAYGGGIQGKPLPPCRQDGGPTSYAANIGFIDQASNVARKDEVRREYNLAFADFAILYNADLRPANPPSRQADLMLPHNVRDGLKPKPEGISTEDPGTRLLNYRNEPIPLRIAEEDTNSLEYHQKINKEGAINTEGDMANIFSSLTHKNKQAPEPVNKRIEKLKKHAGHEITDEKELTNLIVQQRTKTQNFLGLLKENEPWRESGDPSTPMLAANEEDPLQLHLIQGSQEEQHVFSLTGMKWLAEPQSRNSGYMNGQQIGISEHFEFEVSPQLTNTPTDYWYGSPAVENAWDGMWGLMRSFAMKKMPQKDGSKKFTSKHPDWLAELPGHAGRLFGTSSTCPDGDVFAPKKEFFVTAWRVADLLGGIVESNKFYNTRFNIGDPNAVVLVEVPKEIANSWKNGKEIWHYLKELYGTKKRPLEPLILRANAGDCVTVKFKNYLPTAMADGVQFPKSWSYNLVPPIVNGFNFNQFQMSSAIGLVPQLVTEDGAAKNSHNNFGKTLEGQAMQSFPHGCQLKNSNSFMDCDFMPANQESGKISKNFASEAVYEWYLGDRKSLSVSEIEEAEVQITHGHKDLKECVAATKNDFSCYVVHKDRQPEGDKITAIVRYQPMEFGATAIRNFGDIIKGSSHGAVGAFIVEPRGAECQLEGQAQAELCGPIANSDTDQQIKTRASADVTVPNKEKFRDFVLVMQDDLSLQQNGQMMPNHRMADDAEDTGQKGFNYRTESLWARNGMGTSGADFNDLNQLDYTDSLSSKKNISPCKNTSCDPETPIFEATKGQKVRFRIVHPGGHSRQHALAIYGHNWEYQPWGFDSTMMQDDNSPDDTKDTNRHVSSRLGAIGGLGPSRHVNILTTAGGFFCVPGDYLYRVQENFQFNGGMWGIFRVNDTEITPKSCHHP